MAQTDLDKAISAFRQACAARTKKSFLKAHEEGNKHLRRAQKSGNLSSEEHEALYASQNKADRWGDENGW